MQQYIDIMNKIITDGEWIYNERTGKKCRTLINADMEYDFCPLVTTRKSYYKSAIAEFVGYLRGYTSAADFRALGTKTWDANANENQAWLNNPYRKGEDDMGRVYGAQGRSWRKPDFYCMTEVDDWDNPLPEWEKSLSVDQVRNIYEDLKAGIDNRGEIMTFLNVGEFHMGCLRPCVHTHQFSLVNGTLHLHSYQRSNDWPLGCNFNMMQCYFFLQLMAQVTGNKAGKVYHKTVNAHIYEDQFELAKEEASRKPFKAPEFWLHPDIKTLEDVETIFNVNDHILITDYEYHPEIKYPFSV